MLQIYDRLAYFLKNLRLKKRYFQIKVQYCNRWYTYVKVQFEETYVSQPQVLF